MDDIPTLREQAREAARDTVAAQKRMDALLPMEPLFNADPVSQETWDQWEAAYRERELADARFVATMRHLIGLRSARRGR